MEWSGGEVAKLLARAEQARRAAGALCTSVSAGAWVPASAAGCPAGVRRRYPAHPGAAPLARAAVLRLAAVAGMPGHQLESVRVAVSEVVTQAVGHARRKTHGHVHLTATIAGSELVVLIADDGLGPREPLGQDWAWAVIADGSDEFAVSQRSLGGTEVEMRWHVARDEAAATGGAPTGRFIHSG
ncbi:MAG TPA: ATP-binding protein [Solirubrobacteraceae bacterium]|nr:ATP-binding protein [Solirubrobacteraceae bacterium]